MQHVIFSHNEWLAARRAHLAREKELTSLRDQLSAERRQLPRVKVEKAHVFDSPSDGRPLGELFAGWSQLILYHFMFGPGWTEGCKSCSFLADHLDGARVDLARVMSPWRWSHAYPCPTSWHFSSAWAGSRLHVRPRVPGSRRPHLGISSYELQRGRRRSMYGLDR